MPMTPAGHTQQSSIGYLVTRDTTSVRHEEPRADQTKKMIEQPYDPLQKRPPHSIAAWQATLLAHPDDFNKDISNLEQQLNKLLDTTAETRKGRSGASRARRIIADAISAPDKGNVKANREKAIRLGEKPASNKLQKKSPFAVEELRDGYTSMTAYLDVMSGSHLQQQISHLELETRELIDVLEDALKTADQIRKGNPSSDAAGLERTALLEAMTANPAAAKEALIRHSNRCNELTTERKNIKETLDRVRHLQENCSPIESQLHDLDDRLKRAERLRDVALGLQASQAAGPMIQRLKKLENALHKLAADTKTDLDKSIKDLNAAHTAEIGQALDKLHGLEDYPDKDELRNFIRTNLNQCLNTPDNTKAHAIPTPMVVDIYISALAKALESEEPLDADMHAKTMELITSLPGGLLAMEQITGNPITDKNKRVAHRVEALANTTLDRLTEEAGNNAPTSERKVALTLAAETAAKVKDQGNYNDCSELERACYNAVRNSFFTRLNNDTGIDAKLTKVNDRLTKMLTEWVADTSRSGLRNIIKDKTPFSDKTLGLAALTSTLGYDVPARPMARLDKNMLSAVQRLRDLVPQETIDEIAGADSSSKAIADLSPNITSITPASLTTEQVFKLGSLLLAEQKSKETKNLRPGHVKLGSEDANALHALVQEHLSQLVKKNDGPITLAAINTFIKKHGEKATNPYSLVDLVDEIKANIMISDDNGKSKQLFDNLLRSISIVRYMTATEEVTQIRSLDQLYDYLAPKVYQFELRGKLKTSEGGNMGLSTKAFTWPLSLDPGIISVVLPIRGEVKAGGTRCAVFEIGFSTTGFEIFVGSENRTMKGGGSGLGPRVGWESAVSSGGGIDKTLTFERSDTNGVWLRLPRAGDDEATRDQALAVLNTLFGRDTDVSPHDNGKDSRIGQFMQHNGTSIMPRIVGELLARHPNLSISSVGTYHEETVRNEAGLSASALTIAGGSGDDASRIQILGAGSRSERRSKLYRQSDETGFMQITRSNALSGGNTWGQAGIISVNGLFAINPLSSTSDNFGGLAAGSRQFAETGVDTKLRYITRDGETNAVDTRVDIEDVNIANHINRVNKNQHELVTLGAEQLFKTAKEKPPVHEQMRIAKQWLYDILDQTKEKSQGNSRHVFSISNCLNASPAAVMDGLAAKAELERIHNNGLQAKQFDNQRDTVLRHPDSFKPWKVTTSERTSETRQLGWTFGVTYAKVQKTEGQRGTNSYPA